MLQHYCIFAYHDSKERKGQKECLCVRFYCTFLINTLKYDHVIMSLEPTMNLTQITELRTFGKTNQCCFLAVCLRASKSLESVKMEGLKQSS